MKMIMRWYGTGHDNVSLKHIRQIPNVTGIAGTLMDKLPGEVWTMEEINALKTEVNEKGLELEVIESVNIHDDIKLGLPAREQYISNYKETIANLGKAGVRVICYNFMPVLDWMRTDLHKSLPDGSETICYENAVMESIQDYNEFVRQFEKDSKGFTQPGWEPERLTAIQALFKKYEGITSERLYENLRYFLQQIIPVCEEYNVKMAIHPDDPPWTIFGLPRVFCSEESAGIILNLVDSPYNGLTLCTGSLGVDQKNNVPEIIRKFGDRIHFAHVRNFKKTGERDFYESSHFSADGTLDMYEVVRALYESAHNCYIRPDHGRMIWDEQGRPGYGLYDRALGVAYINGLWEALDKQKRRA